MGGLSRGIVTWQSSFTAKAASACDLASKAAWTHPDSAASRAYYAVVAGLNALLGPPPTGRPRRHGDLHSKPSLAALGLGLGEAGQVKWLSRLRLQADYQEDPVREMEATIAAGVAAAILARMGAAPP